MVLNYILVGCPWFLFSSAVNLNSEFTTVNSSIPRINWGSFRGRREEKWGSFRGRFGDHFRVGDHFGGCTDLLFTRRRVKFQHAEVFCQRSFILSGSINLKCQLKKLTRHTLEQYHGIIVLNYRTIKFNHGEPQALATEIRGWNSSPIWSEGHCLNSVNLTLKLMRRTKLKTKNLTG